MKQLYDEDKANRTNLTKLFERTRAALEKLPPADKVRLQLHRESLTRDWGKKLKNFKACVDRDQCPLVVAGQFFKCFNCLLLMFFCASGKLCIGLVLAVIGSDQLYCYLPLL